MALYTLKTEEDALKPLKDYNGNSEWVKNRAVELGVRQAPTDTNSYFNENLDSRYDELKNADIMSKNQGYKTLLGSTWDSANNSLNKAVSKLTQNISGDLTADSARDAFSRLSNDDKWDVYQNLQKARNEFNKSYTKADNENNEELKSMYGAGLKYADLYNSILGDIDKGDKSFGKSVGDWLSSGGVAGNMAQPVTNAMGDVGAALGDTGAVATAKAIQNNYQMQNEGNNPIVQAVDTTGNLAGNIGLATMTGGIAPLVTSGANLAHEGISAMNDADRAYYTDENGNIVRQNQTDAQKGADIGGAALNVGLNLLGAKGIGPSMNFGNGTLQGLAQSGNYGEIAKGLGKYALKEVPWALATSAADTAIQSMGYGQDAWNNFGDNVGKNILGDVAMDVAGAVREGNTGNRDLLASNKKQATEQGSPETELYRTVTGSTTSPEAKTWDDIAKQSGYKDYDDLVIQFKQTNPNVEASASNILDFADMSVDANKKTFTDAKSGNVIKNERKIQEEIINQFNPVGQPTVRATKPRETFYNLYNKMGLSDENQIRQAVHYAEPGELIPTMIREAAGQASIVGMAEAQKMVSDLRLGKRQNYTKTLDVLEDIIDSTPSSISGGKNGVDALTLQRAIEQAARDAEGSNGTYHIGSNLVDATTAKNLRRISENIGENLDKAVAENKGIDYVKNKYADEIQKMRNSQPNNPKWAQFVDENVSGAKTIGDLRHSIKDLTRASIYINDGDERFGTMGSNFARSNATVPTSKSGMTNRIVNEAVSKIASTPQAMEIRLKRAQKAIEKDNSMNGTPEANNTKLWSKLKNQTSKLKRSKMEQETNSAPRVRYPQSQVLWNTINRENNTTGETAPAIQEAEIVPDNIMQNGAQMQGVQANQAGYFYPPTGDQWSDMLSQAMVRANEAGDIDALVELNDMYQTQASKLSKSGQSSANNLNATQQAQLAKFDAAGNAIDQLENLFDQAGGGKGPIAGTLQSIAGNWGWDSNAKTYNDLSEGLVNQIAQAIGKTDSLNTEGEVQRALKLIPQLNDDATTAKNKLETLRQMLSTTKQSYNTAYGINQY